MSRIINVQFHADSQNSRSRTYAYYTDDESVSVGDTVVVDAPSSGLTCVKVISTQETVESVEKVGKWVVQKVDDTAYRARVERENRRAVVIAKIKKAKESLIMNSELEQLAKLDPTLAGLIDELKGL